MSDRAASFNATTLGCSLTCKELETAIRFSRVDMTFEHEGKLAGAVISAGDIRTVLNQDDGRLLIDEPADRPRGARMFQFRHPDGFRLGVSTPLGR